MLHRTNDKPAIIYSLKKEWWKYGKKHRETRDENGMILPAVVWDNCEEWWINGKRHRDNDLPAVVWMLENIVFEWWKSGERHRDNGLPSIEWSNGCKEWWEKGKFIRDNIIEVSNIKKIKNILD